MSQEDTLPVSPIAEQVIGIAAIHQETGPEFLAKLIDQSPGERAAAIATLVRTVKELVIRIEGGASTKETTLTPITPDQYVLPPELAALNERLLAHLPHPNTNNGQLSHVGVVLHGIPGTGKSEYPRYLKGQLGDNVIVVYADVSAIRNADAPGVALRDFYTRLEEKARVEGKYVVLLIDEFEKLVTKYAKVRSVRSDSASTFSTERSSSTKTTSHTEDEMTLDTVGEDLLNELKTILSGTGNIHRVFTIATTNQTNLPAEITRDGRLEAITLETIGMETFNHTNVPVYDEYRRILPRIIAILEATHRRIKGEASPVLAQLRAIFDEFFSKEPAYETYKNVLTKPPDYSSDIPRRSMPVFYERNNELMKKLLALFGYDFDAFPGYPDQISFGGHIDKSDEYAVRPAGSPPRRRIGEGLLDFEEGAFPEVALSRELTPSQLAGFYKNHQDQFAEIGSAKRALAELLFPQLV